MFATLTRCSWELWYFYPCVKSCEKLLLSHKDMTFWTHGGWKGFNIHHYSLNLNAASFKQLVQSIIHLCSYTMYWQYVHHILFIHNNGNAFCIHLVLWLVLILQAESWIPRRKMSCWQKKELPSGLSTNTCEYACGGSSSACNQQRKWVLNFSTELHIYIPVYLVHHLCINLTHTKWNITLSQINCFSRKHKAYICSQIKNLGKDVIYN